MTSISSTRPPYEGEVVLPGVVVDNTPSLEDANSSEVITSTQSSSEMNQIIQRNSMPPNIERILASFKDEKKIKHSSPLSVIADIYQRADTLEQKRACFLYLLQYQQYNAGLPKKETERLGYPLPLSAVQERAGYFRTDYDLPFSVMRPWFEKCFVPFLHKIFIKKEGEHWRDLTKLASSCGLGVLRTFFPTYMEKLKVIPVSFSDLDNPEPLSKMLQTSQVKDRFLFSFQVAGVDCFILWGATKTEEGSFKVEALNRKLFPGSVFSLLNYAGAAPDRIELNKFMTQGQGEREFLLEKEEEGFVRKLQESGFLETLRREEFEQGLAQMGITASFPKTRALDRGAAVSKWSDRMNAIATYCFGDDLGSALYRDAILRWHQRFFQEYKLVDPVARPVTSSLIASLLSSQVLPWMSKTAGIVEWAKAYQNMCEIVMFCLEAFPQSFSSIDVSLEAFKAPAPLSLYQRVGLFPYAMGGVFDILWEISSHRPTQKKLEVGCVAQGYFETLDILEKMSQHFKPSKVNSLEELGEIPDVLIAEIHPNNAAREFLFQNDIVTWVQEALNKEGSKKMTLILDITLNQLSDPEIKILFIKLSDFIQKGKLEIFWIQSLAKLVQLGADNFSGGICGYLGAAPKDPGFPDAPRAKKAFFSVLGLYFQDLISEYFTQVRKNTERMYQDLQEDFSKIKNRIWIKDKEAKSNGTSSLFCATEVKLNGDHNTVYVAVSFSPVLRLLNNTQKQKEDLVKDFQQMLLKLAEQRKLPLTGRQSFGFSLSNISVVVDAIRFSIGVESEEIREEYARLIGDFSLMLSSYVVQDPDINLERFEKMIQRLCAILEGRETRAPLEVDLADHGYNEYGPIGKAEICFEQGKLTLRIKEEGKPLVLVDQSEIGMADAGGMSSLRCDSSDLMKFLFQWIVFEEKKAPEKRIPFYVEVNSFNEENTYSIVDRNGEVFHLSDRGSVEVHGLEGSSATLGKPFALTCSEGTFTKDRVFVEAKATIKTQKEGSFGTSAVKLSQLNHEKLDEVYRRCVRNHFAVTKYLSEPGCVLITFQTRKPYLDYHDEIVKAFNEGGIPSVVEFLNRLDADPKKLPLTHDCSWRGYQQEPQERIIHVLKELGDYIVYRSGPELPTELRNIKEENYKKAVIEGMWRTLFYDSLQRKSLHARAVERVVNTFSSEEIIKSVDRYAFDHWVEQLDKNTKDNPEGLESLASYLKALFPVIRFLYENPGSLLYTERAVSLCEIGKRVEGVFPPLKAHMEGLENALPGYAAEHLKKASQLTSYLQLYVNYPLSDQVREGLLNALSTFDALCLQWIMKRHFYYYPLDSLEVDEEMLNDEEFFTEKHRAQITSFFKAMKGEELLQRVSKEERGKHIHAMFRWGTILQDIQLLAELLSICEKDLSKEDGLDVLQWYEDCLEIPEEIKAQILSTRESIEKKEDSITSDLED